MARRRRTRRVPIALGLALLVVAGAVVWLAATRFGGRGDLTAPPLAVGADRIDAANDGRRVRLSGRLAYARPPRDAELGVSAEAAILLRHVEMYQWHERCDAGDCRYAAAWSAEHVDSRRFRAPAGHENPPFPFADARFAAAGLRLGAFAVDADVVAAELAAVDHPVRIDALPPNLAASFREFHGVLYAGDDPEHPAIGALRVSFRIVPAGEAKLTGVQRGERLAAQ